MALLNARSVLKNFFLLNDFFLSNNLDFLFITETWLMADDLKSNQIKSLLLSHHHSTSALVSEILTSVLQTVQKNNNNNLHMDSTYLQTVQKTMCKIYIHILSTHSVL